MDIFIAFIIGLLIGSTSIFLIFYIINKNKQLTKEEQEKKQELFMSKAKETFREISDISENKILNMNKTIMEREKQAAEESLKKDKNLINENLNHISSSMKEKLNEVYEYMQNLEKNNTNQFGKLAKALEIGSEETKNLNKTTQKLKEALTNTKIRGQWGERMAEDILKLLGFIEGINYQKQQQHTDSKSKPDFTFILPNKQIINMDVKFPLNNYLKFIESKDEQQKNNYKSLFIKDVNNRIKDIANREGYIAENTLDYTIVFIPNEQIYSFINETDISILDKALKNKIIICSPFTLYAVLSIIRQANENFNTEKRIGEMLNIFGNFRKEWDKFKDLFDKIGKKLSAAQDEFNKLSSTRQRKLDIQLDKIDQIKTSTIPKIPKIKENQKISSENSLL